MKKLWSRLFRRFRSDFQEEHPPLPPVNGYIYGQRHFPEQRIGQSSMDAAGCEVIAVYNALRRVGYHVGLEQITNTFERRGYLMRRGQWGADPFAIGDYLSDAGIPYVCCRQYDALVHMVNEHDHRYCAYIVSFWNRRTVWGGLHTVAFTVHDGQLYVYNLTGAETHVTMKPKLGSFVKKKRFLVGYVIFGRER